MFSTVVGLLPQPPRRTCVITPTARFQESRERGGEREAVAEGGRLTCGAGGGASLFKAALLDSVRVGHSQQTWLSVDSACSSSSSKMEVSHHR